jgi:hypothetical protein
MPKFGKLKAPLNKKKPSLSPISSDKNSILSKNKE